MYGTSPEQIAAIRGGAERQVEAQHIAGDNAVFGQLNDSMSQAYESPNMPAFQTRFPFP
jgi:hypothetical protein